MLATGKTASRLLEEGQLEVLFEVIEPPPHLFIFGGEHDALPVARLARSLDWTVTVCEPHARVGSRTRLAGVAAYAAGTPAELAAAVKHAARPLALIMSHRYEFDRDVLKELLSIRTLYLGLLGPSRRAQRMLAELQAAGVPIDAAARQRVHAPVGLDLGAETPAEIALSAIAEAQAHLAQATGQRLRERPGAIHAA